MPPRQTTHSGCSGEAWRSIAARTIRRTSSRPCASCAHYEECPESSLAAYSCYYEDHPERTPLS